MLNTPSSLPTLAFLSLNSVQKLVGRMSHFLALKFVNFISVISKRFSLYVDFFSLFLLAMYIDYMPYSVMTKKGEVFPLPAILCLCRTPQIL